MGGIGRPLSASSELESEDKEESKEDDESNKGNACNNECVGMMSKTTTQEEMTLKTTTQEELLTMVR